MLTTLKIIEALGRRCDYTSAALCEEFKISLATLKRHIAEARHLGAQIESYRESNTSWYRLKNWKECQLRVKHWIDLIERESILSN